ncbi:DUF1433 domain-containing protein [Rummeliibacillus stabekisii]|uniref:DUF1433 domain-containing protein n=1 Tax=Rummeliibacillus stabekisii TaxID=241244 RepID=UPI0037218091
MKKNILFITVSILLLISAEGYFIYHHEKQEKQEKYFTKQEQRVEKFLTYNIPRFKTVTFTKEDVSPMGLPYLEGYVNNDKRLDFVAHVQPNDHNFEGRMGMPKELDALFRADVKTYSEIVKEEHTKKQ